MRPCTSREMFQHKTKHKTKKNGSCSTQKGRKRTRIGAELNDVGERAVSFVVPRLDLEKVGRVRRQAFDGGGHLVADDAFNHPISIPLRVIRRVEDDVACRQGRDLSYNQIASITLF